MLFRDRKDAGLALAARLAPLRGKNVVVVALPRGGLPIGRAVADALGAPLDILVARKIGAPGNEEFAIGAVTARGHRVLNEEAIETYGISMHYVDEITERQKHAAAEREAWMRGVRPKVSLEGKIALLVDDGVATGMTMQAALHDARNEEPARLIVAIPVIARRALAELEVLADEVIRLHVPEPFHAVGQFYMDFTQVTDAEARAILVGTGAAAATPA